MGDTFTNVFGNSILFVLSIAFSIWSIRETVDKLKSGIGWHKWGTFAAVVSGVTASYLVFILL